MTIADERTVDIWGFPVTPLSIDETVEFIRSCWNTEGERRTLLFQNLHTLYLQSGDQQYLDCFDDTVVLIDGIPLVHLLRWCGHEVLDDQRAPAIDMIDPVAEAAIADNAKIFVIGQEEGVLRVAISRLRKKYPDLHIGGHHGFFDKDGDASEHVIQAANDFEADLVLVGFGSPISEIWVDKHRDSFDASVVWVCGALMEYVAGAVPTPPRWSGPIGIEWMFRFANDPPRFLYRYFMEPLVLGQRIARRRLRGL